MQLRVLGPVDLHDNNEPIALPGTRLPRLLATLAAADGRTVAVGALADAIWGGAAPPTAAGAIQVAVSQARRLIAQGSEPGPSIVTETGGYRLVATAEQLDLLAFHDLLDRARRCAHEQRHHDRADHLQRALALWRGEPFGALDDAGTVAAEGRRLHELRLDAEEDLVATQVQLGREREVLPTITRLLGDHPFRERLVGLQMLALYRAGRPVEALDTYEQFRRRLRDELGVQPGKELRSLERLVLLQHPSLDLANTPPTAAQSVAEPSAASVYVSIGPMSGDAAPPLEHRDARSAIEAAVAGRALGCGVAASPVDAELLALAAPPGRVLVDAVVAGLVRDQPTVELRDLGEHRLADLGRPRHVYEVVTPGAPKGLIRSCSVVPISLGSEPTAFVGRRALRARLGSVVAGARMVTLVGPPGAGKTRLARRVAAEQAWAFPGGAWLVELGPVATAADLELAIVSALQLTVRVDAEPMAELGTRLQTRTLVVLDNAEHLVDELAPLLASLVERAPASVFMVTSRRRLGVQGEVVVPVGPLIDNDAALAEPERRAGLDDALAILRARLADLGGHSVDEATAQALVEQVDGLPLAIELVAGQVAALGGATVLERLHQLLAGDALEAALRGSEQLLGDVDRAVLRRMSVFTAPVDLRAAEAVVADGEVLEAEVAPALARLVEASLLGVVEVAGVRRFRMLATVRVLAAQRLAEAGGDEAAATLDRHAHWAARSGWKLAAALVGREPAAARNELELLLPNLRATFAHLEAGDDRDRHIFAVAGMWFFWYFTGRLHEGRAITLAAVRRPGGRPQHRALGLAAAANLAWWQCDYREARRCLAEARAVTGVPEDLAFFEIVDGALAWIEGDLDAAATSLRAAMARAREAGRFDLPMAAAMAGNVEWWRGDHGASAAIYREGREASVTARNAFTAALCARHEALQLGLMGRVDEARPLAQQALAECRRLGDVMGEGQSLVYAGLIELQAGHAERATLLLAEGVRTAVQPGDLFCLVVAAPAVAELLMSHGDGDEVAAARWLGWRDATMARAVMVPAAAQQAHADAVGVRVAEVLGDADRLHRAEGAALTLDELAASLAGW